MPTAVPPLPPGRPSTFRATVHGTVFSDRARHLDALGDGAALVLHADPPGEEEPEVWVHLPSGDPVGHLPPEVSVWMGPWLRAGGRARVRALRVGPVDEPSWRRLFVEVTCSVANGS